jgi:hypothetical protein
VRLCCRQKKRQRESQNSVTAALNYSGKDAAKAIQQKQKLRLL